jgi:hypothetical protein
MNIHVPNAMADHVRLALQMRANFIETGDPLLCANDVAERLRGSDLERRKFSKNVKYLDTDQRFIIAFLRDTADRIKT